MDNIQNIRHSLAHLLAKAVLSIYPNTLPTIGPSIDNGFYYDFDFGDKKITDEDLAKIETKMKQTLPSWETFVRIEVSVEEAKNLFKNTKYKTELIDEIEKENQVVSIYYSGPKNTVPTKEEILSESYELPENAFLDLCRGGHSENPSGEIDSASFQLDKLAGAYWRGDEKNKMLTRIYGLAFETKEELEKYLIQREEALKRDHRKLGKELELFTNIEEIGPGLPLFYPKGTILRRTIENFIQETQEKLGYEPIWIPHITKESLYKISGHLDKYDAMYSPMLIDEDNYYLKPMNCPHFMMLYKSKVHSYKELPVRYTCTTTNYRYEKSGELSGLTRVRALTQDDCHVFCEPEKIKTEITLILNMIKEVYSAFGLNDFYVRISLRDSKDISKYLGSEDVWEIAENALREIIKETGWKYEEAENEAAFYGPKLDFMFNDVIGREWQLSTVQLDFNLPERFELEYTNTKGEKARPVVIHRAVLGSTERFMGIMIEHYAGAFPLWLSPVQVAILPISDKHLDYANKIKEELLANGIRAELDDRLESVGKKIREATVKKTPYMVILGDKEIQSEGVSVRSRNGEDLGAISLPDFLNKLKEEINSKTGDR